MTSTRPAPLVAAVTPIPGESFMSLLSRACEANAFLRVSELLTFAGYTGVPRLAPIMGAGCAAALAALLSLPQPEIAQRLHVRLSDEVDPDLIAWLGAKMERRFFDPVARRVAPASLQISAHHRAAWTNRALSFCPETFQILTDRCAACGRGLGWSRTYGLTRCEHCRASLLQIETPFVDEALHGRLGAATDLISHDADVRSRVLGVLPEPFCGWDPGEVFCAIVEFGVAWERAEEGRGSQTARSLSGGRLPVSPAMIASGYDVCRGWPQSLAELISRSCRAMAQAGSPTPLKLRNVSVLSRHLDLRLPQTKLRQLIRAELPDAALAAKTPARFRRLSQVRSARSGALMLKEAEEKLAVSRQVIRRLVPHGESYRAGRVGRGGAALLDAQRLKRATAAYLGATADVEVAARLGIPSFVVSALKGAGLLTDVRDVDAVRMAQGPLTTTRSLQRLIADVRSKPEAAGAEETFQRVMAGWFASKAWAAAVEAIVKGEVGVGWIQEGRSGGLFNQVYIEREAMEAYLSRKRLPKPIGGFDVNTVAAGLLLGISSHHVTQLVECGVLEGSRDPSGWRIAMDALIAFKAEYILSTDIDYRRNIGPFSAKDDTWDGVIKTTGRVRYMTREHFKGPDGSVMAW